MVSSSQNRKKFIESAMTYMHDFGFAGVDLDWEYPGDHDRGGRKREDTNGFRDLVKEMRAAFTASKSNNPGYLRGYGISLTLAPDISCK